MLGLTNFLFSDSDNTFSMVCQESEVNYELVDLVAALIFVFISFKSLKFDQFPLEVLITFDVLTKVLRCPDRFSIM